jgi:hypothetical protein
MPLTGMRAERQGYVGGFWRNPQVSISQRVAAPHRLIHWCDGLTRNYRGRETVTAEPA